MTKRPSAAWRQTARGNHRLSAVGLGAAGRRETRKARSGSFSAGLCTVALIGTRRVITKRPSAAWRRGALHRLFTFRPRRRAHWAASAEKASFLCRKCRSAPGAGGAADAPKCAKSPLTAEHSPSAVGQSERWPTLPRRSETTSAAPPPPRNAPKTARQAPPALRTALQAAKNLDFGPVHKAEILCYTEK